MRPVIQNGLLIIGSLIVATLLGEVAARLSGLRPLPLGIMDTNTREPSVNERDIRLGFRPRPNQAYANRKIDGAPKITTDRYGYRNGVGWDPNCTMPIVAFVGDSTTFGAEVSDDQTGPSEVARLLPGRCILNGGVRGYNTLQSKRRMQEILERFSDVRAVVYLYTSNDYVENLNPIVYFPAVAPTMRYDAANGSITEVEIDPSLIPHDEAVNDAPLARKQPDDIPFRVRVSNWIRSKSALGHHGLLTLRRIMPRERDAPLTVDGGWLGPINSNEPFWKEQLERAHRSGGNEILRSLLTSMDKLAAHHGAVFITTCFTRQQGDENCRQFAEQAHKSGVRYVDLSPVLTQSPISYASPRVDGTYDGHYGALGMKAFAEAVAPVLRSVLSDN